VVIPPGCYPGSEIIVDVVGEQELAVTVPEGCAPGEVLIVAVPAAGKGDELETGGTLVDAIVPDNCAGGEEIIVDVGGRELTVVVPLGLKAGDLMEVVVPPAPPSPAGAPPSPAPDRQQHAPDSPAPATPSSLPQPAPPAKPPAPSALRAAAPAPERVLPAELSDSSDDDEGERCAKFAVGQPVEVLRSDGPWTVATVTEYDEHGCTYTVQIVDGRCKYFVEEHDLRIPRFLLLSTANL